MFSRSLYYAMIFESSNINSLMSTFSQPGELCSIYIRPEKRSTIQLKNAVHADVNTGLQGDHYSGRTKKRQVTLIQLEHIDVIAKLLGKSQLDASLFRRNLVIKHINILSLKNKSFQIGETLFKMTGLCHPCSRMEDVLGPGGYNCMRGHGGITATIIKSGMLHVGDRLNVVD